MRLLTAAVLALAAARVSAQTRPLLTEEATTGPAGRIVLEAGVDGIRDEPNYLTGGLRDRWEGPVLRLVYSPAASVEVDLEWTARVGVRDDPDFGSISDWGDVVLRSKVRLADEGRGPAVAARFGVALPETTFGNGLGPDTLRMSAQILLSKEIGRLAVHANAGLAIQDRPTTAHVQSDFLAYGLALTAAVGESLAAVVELNGLGGGRGAPGADRRSELRGGLRYDRGPWGLDGAVRRGLADADGTWGATVGLSWTLRERR